MEGGVTGLAWEADALDAESWVNSRKKLNKNEPKPNKIIQKENLDKQYIKKMESLRKWDHNDVIHQIHDELETLVSSLSIL